MESRTSRLRARGETAEAAALLPPTFWLDALREFHQRRRQQRGHDGVAVPAEPGISGGNNWTPIGPSVARRAQVSGRIARIAVALGGSRVYVATALGGVWRSDDSGATWLTNEDSFDVDPTAFAATSLCCGAIAIDPSAPDRVYVGTGEGDINDFFSSRFLNSLPTYRGVGPVRSDDGGASWVVEPVAPGSPPLAGAAFYALAVDPGDRENVVGATTAGLYRREPDGAGGYHWVQKRTGIHTAVIAGRSGTTTTFVAAQRAGGVFSSPDGSTWSAAGTGFPGSGLARISLAMRGTDPSVVYALAENTSTFVVNLFRLAGGTWSPVAMSAGTGTEGGYTLGLAVDPNDVTRLYFSTVDISRGSVSVSGGTYSCAVTFIGGTHSDVHELVYAAGDSTTLWVGTDGGAYVSDNAQTAAVTFTPRNTGLATMATEYFAQHPTQPAVILCGTQDNATMRYTGEEAWLQVTGGDGGACLVNWNDPYEMMAFQNGALLHSTNGGASFPTNVAPPGYSWTQGLMAPPMAIAPQSAAPSDARIIALGGDRPYLSPDFGGSWTSLPNNAAGDALGSKVSAVAFASPTKLYVGTVSGKVFRYDKSGATWTRTEIDNAASGALPLASIVKSIIVDTADASGNSVYLSFGGSGDYRHVWHFDGTAWAQRSGPAAGAATALLDVEHGAIAVDPTTPTTLYVGSDVGVWSSSDSGANWSVLSSGLPDAAVLDLQIHQASRMLRASLHGRGLFELKLDAPAPADVVLYVRDTDLDLARATTSDYLPDPENQGQVVVHWESPNIKVDVPTPAGYQTPSAAIDFYQFVDTIVDGSGGVATMDPASGTVTDRVYVEVHNHGFFSATSVNVMLLLCDASPHLPALPSGYTANVQAGTAVGGAFTLVGVRSVSNLRAGFPQVVEFPLPSTMLPPPASLPGDSHYCLVALLHSSQDAFASTQTDVDMLTITDRKVAQKNLHIVAFVGTPPPPAPWQWGEIHLHGGLKEARLTDLVVDTQGYGGRVGLVLPKTLVLPNGLDKSLVNFTAERDKDVVEDWAERHRVDLRRFMAHGRYDFRKAGQMLERLEQTAGQPMLLAERGSVAELRGVELKPGAGGTAFIAIERPAEAKVGENFQFRVLQRDHHSGKVLGGCTYSVQILAPHPRKVCEPVEDAATEIDAPITDLVPPGAG
ncbi:hypothetical protein WI37_20760 [Burkholderia ubonensis]|nr:hypothetical protein WI37_20760 [Burkholderia ubonensis]